jgi:hypothetical protein
MTEIRPRWRVRLVVTTASVGLAVATASVGLASCSSAGQENPPKLECLDSSECTPPRAICGPFGSCQWGGAGDPCSNHWHCDENAGLFCGSEGSCRDGGDGEPCFTQLDCRHGNRCVQGFCR